MGWILSGLMLLWTGTVIVLGMATNGYLWLFLDWLPLAVALGAVGIFTTLIGLRIATYFKER